MTYHPKNICNRLTRIGAVNPEHFTHFYVDDVNAYHGKILSSKQIKDINKKYKAGELNVCIKHVIPAIPASYPLKLVYQSKLVEEPKEKCYIVLDQGFHVTGNPEIVSSQTYVQRYTTTSTVSKNIQLCILPNTISGKE